MSYQEEAYKVFNSEGKLLQVEYALESLNYGLPSVVVCGKNFVVSASKLKTMSKLESEQRFSTYKISNGLYMVISGREADVDQVLVKANKLASDLKYDFNYKVLRPDVFAREFSELFLNRIQRNEKRILSFSCSIIGFIDNEPVMYYVDLSCVEVAYHAVAFGQKNVEMIKYLEDNYQEDMNEQEGYRIAISALLKSVGDQTSSSNIEVTLFNNSKSRRLHDSEINDVIDSITLD